jgi:hypothetical protein
MAVPKHRALAVVPVALVVALALGGCGQDTTAGPDSQPTAARPENSVTPSPSPGDPGGTPSAAQPGDPVVAAAVRDLSSRLTVEPSAIRVVSAEEVTWRDGSIGCPQPGMMYPQVLTDGSRVVLEAEGRRYEYHAGGRRSAFLCENPEPPAGR